MSVKIQSTDIKNQKKQIPKLKTNFLNKYRTLDLGSYKMFFTYENNQLVYKFI